MQPDATAPLSQPGGLLKTLSAPWRNTLALLAIGSAVLIGVSLREWGEMAHQWWNIDTYTHVLLVPIIIGWLVYLKLEQLAQMTPRAWLPGLGIVAAGLGLWLAGRTSDINIIAHAGAVGALQGLVITAIGPRVSAFLALPLCFGVFLVPVGDEFIPALQSVTADIAVALTHWSGIPASVDGIYIDTPVGLFIVAEACSGVRFLIAMITLAVLVCFTRFESWTKRALFMAVSIIVPIIANGIRAWGTIYIAQSQGVEFAAGFDHIFYGWIFFAIIVAVILSAAWRYFDREPEDYGWSEAELASFGVLHRIERGNISPIVGFAGVAALSILAAIAATIVAPVAIG
jgi:exosortase A